MSTTARVSEIMRRQGQGVELLVALALVVGLLFASPSGAMPMDGPDDSSEETTGQMAGLTVLSGSTSGYTEVLVPTGARLLFRLQTDETGVDFVPALEDVSGEGRLVGFALEGAEAATRPVSAVALRLPEVIDALRSVAVGTISNPSGDSTFCNTEPCVLPAGRYRLYLIADGSPVTVHIRLEGLDGVTHLEPATTVQSSQQLNDESGPDLRSVAGLWYGGVSDVLAARGRVVGLSWAEGSRSIASAASWQRCLYFGDQDEVTTATAYAPGCPGADFLAVVAPTVVTGRASSVSIDTLKGAPAGRYGVGGNATYGGARIERAGAAGLWLAWD